MQHISVARHSFAEILLSIISNFEALYVPRNRKNFQIFHYDTKILVELFRFDIYDHFC